MTLSDSSSAPLSGRRILLLEDVPVNQMIVTRWLRGAGAEVVCAATLAEARVLIASEMVFHGALLDCHLPDGEGAELLPPLRERAIPRVLAMTSIDEESDRDALLALGFDGVLAKPLTSAGLRAAFADG